MNRSNNNESDEARLPRPHEGNPQCPDEEGEQTSPINDAAAAPALPVVNHYYDDGSEAIAIHYDSDGVEVLGNSSSSSSSEDSSSDEPEETLEKMKFGDDDEKSDDVKKASSDDDSSSSSSSSSDEDEESSKAGTAESPTHEQPAAAPEKIDSSDRKEEEGESHQAGGYEENADSEEDEEGEANDETEPLKKKRKRGSGKTKIKSPRIIIPNNPFSRLVRGYRAPMKLTARSLQNLRPQAGGLDEMLQQAKWEESDQAHAQAESVARASRHKFGGMSAAYQAEHGSFQSTKKQRQKMNRAAAAGSFGRGWFNMAAATVTDEVKQDMALIRNRNYLDPKKFYKSADTTDQGKVQVGTVVEGSTEFYSSRLTKKQRRNNLVEEIMADPSSSDYAKKKYKKMAQASSEKHRTWKKQNPNKSAKAFRTLK
eukprot:CAMPEP_0172474488 /NCGR_PEP_ID=MMETSP1065-20121228/69384_1 /TAXON_ID=265537 /ORGANISM="Amphiprora paludosa, Strain CCMP125" /LENGTH=425 /DNA_ID=CAMNT_0013232671 /DNA_START=63 /DNA_END=1340 /DNA_ORIENTATION=+